MKIVKKTFDFIEEVLVGIDTIFNRFKSRELLISLSLLGAAISALILLHDFVANFNDRLAIAGLLFTVTTAGFQWLENSKEKKSVSFAEYKESLNERIDNLSHQYSNALNDIKHTLDQSIKALKKQSDHIDDKHNNEIETLNVKLASLNTIVEQHLSSFGHNATIELLQNVQQKIFYLEAVLNVQSRYAEVLKSLEEVKRGLGEVKKS